MNTRSITFRLVVWYAGWLTLLYIIFGLFVYLSLNHYLRESLREALARRTRQVADLVQRSPRDWDLLDHEIRTHFAPEINNRFTRVSVKGIPRYLSGPPVDSGYDPKLVPPVPSTTNEESFIRHSLPGGRALLIVVLVREWQGDRLMVEEGSSERPIVMTLRAWLAILLIGAGFLILLAVIGGYGLVQRALRPVDRIIGTAERISSHNLSERLPVPDTRDELQRLSTSLNRMIRRLDDAFQYTQRFLADASHELRTPLTIMQAELEAIVERTSHDEEICSIAGSALEEVERLRKIVEGLFALSRLDAGEAMERSAPFDLGELASSTAEQMKLLAEDGGIALSCETVPNVVIEGDRARLKQVLVNLLDNAIKYSLPGGQVSVRVGQASGHAVLDVCDRGIGIPPEAQKHLFERFYRVDKARSRELGGAGLGLSIVKSICTAHGGTITIRSKEGEGTQVTVEFPIAAQKAGAI